MSDSTAPGASLLRLWKRLRPLPWGRWLFSFLLGRRIPYTGTMGARVIELESGRAVVQLRDRRKVRNHLGSIHAVALTNLGELAGGLAMLTRLPPGVRGIVVKLETEYVKKARGTLIAEASWSVPGGSDPDGSDPDEFAGGAEPLQCRVRSTVRDAAGDEVARTTALWHLGRNR